jgi:hypothetical protein
MAMLNIEAVHFSDKPLSFIYRLFGFLSPEIKKAFNRYYLDSIIRNAKIEKYDYVFVIKGTILDEEFMTSLRMVLPGARFVMYQWDSSRTHKAFVQITSFFNKVFTFDTMDAKDYQFEYLPLFYSRLYENMTKAGSPKYDLAFVGEYYPDSDRLDVVKKIDEIFKSYGLNFHYSLRVELLALFKFVFFRQLKLVDLPYISIGRISQNDVIKLYSNTIAVLDVEHIEQTGLTMRTIETLGAGVKLVTTNINIRNEDFFSENKIMVIDRVNPMISPSFFKGKEPERLDQQYSINSWLKQVLRC